MRNHLYYSGLCLLLFCFIACSRENVSNDYEVLKNKSYSSLTNIEQVSFKDQLALSLSEDEHFKLYNEKVKEQALLYATRTRTHGSKVKTKVPRKGSEALQYYKSLGIKDPNAYMAAKLEMIYAYAKISVKYPELKKLDRQTRFKVFKKAFKGFNWQEITKIRNTALKKQK